MLPEWISESATACHYMLLKESTETFTFSPSMSFFWRGRLVTLVFSLLIFPPTFAGVNDSRTYLLYSREPFPFFIEATD